MASKRRSKGEGPISQRPDGRWHGRLDLGRVDGKRKWKHVYGKTKRDVTEKIRKLQGQQDAGYNIAPERLTVAQFLERWLRDTVSISARPRTLERYELAVRLHITPYIGHVVLSKLTADHVQAMYRALLESGRSPTTVQRTRDILRNALNVAVGRQMLQRNVVEFTEPPKPESYQAAILTAQQAQRLLDAARGNRLELLYRMALSLGLREGELLGLRWQDVDLDTRRLHIRVALQPIDGKLVLVEPKTKHSRRTLRLPPTLVQALHAHQARQQDEQLLTGSSWRNHGLVFPSSVGTPLSPSNLMRSFRALLARAGFPPMRFHDLRHSCATYLAMQGVPPKTAMEILGHANISTTMHIYTHVLDEHKDEAVLRVDDLLTNTKEHA